MQNKEMGYEIATKMYGNHAEITNDCSLHFSLVIKCECDAHLEIFCLTEMTTQSHTNIQRPKFYIISCLPNQHQQHVIKLMQHSYTRKMVYEIKTISRKGKRKKTD